MNELAKGLMLVGACLFGLGLLLTVFDKIPGVGKLPGDFVMKKENVTFYFPLASCLILSIILTVILNLFGKK